MEKKPFEAYDGPMLMLLAFMSMLVVQLVFLIIFSALPASAFETVNLIAMIVFQAAYIGVYLAYTKRKNITSTFSPRNRITVWGIIAAVALGLICFFGFNGLAFYFEYLLEATGYRGTGIDATGTFSIILLVIATVFAAPICEETVFRSAFLSGVSVVRRDEIGTSLLCGLCFALMHISPDQTVYQFFLGSTAAFITLKCRNVIPAMIVHSISNSLALIYMFTPMGSALDGFYLSIGENVWITLVGCIVLPIAATVLILFICKAVKVAERKKYAAKFESPKKVVWIDEETLEPVYEGEPLPSAKGLADVEQRLDRQRQLMDEYNKKTAGGKYRYAFIIYFVITALMWIMNFISGFGN